VLNDVGPLIPWPALARLKLGAGGAGARFASVDEVEKYLREACSSFGPLTDKQWRRLAVHGSRLVAKDTYTLAYDSSIISTMRGGGGAGVAFGADFFFGIDLWPIWDAVKSRPWCCGEGIGSAARVHGQAHAGARPQDEGRGIPRDRARALADERGADPPIADFLLP